MQTKLIIFSNYGNKEYLKLSAEDCVDVKSALQAAIKEAKNDNVLGKASNIPNKYLKKYGLIKEEISVIEFDNCQLGETDMERAGVEYACCRHCSAFEDGSCYKYGGIIDPDASGNNCLHGTGIFSLSYDDKDTEYFYITRISTELSEILAIVKDIPAIAEIMSREDYDEKLWKLTEED